MDESQDEDAGPIPPRPVTRGDCVDGPRPCPWVGCRHHLFLDVNPATGHIKAAFPGLEFDEIPETCSLDVADRGGASLHDIGRLMRLTRERVRQIEESALGVRPDAVIGSGGEVKNQGQINNAARKRRLLAGLKEFA